MTDVAAPVFSSETEALAIIKSAMSYLYEANAAQAPAETQAYVLTGLEQIDAIKTAARASYLNAFTSAQGHVSDADYSPRTWLMRKTGITRGAAAGHVGWSRRIVAHPELGKALAAWEISESYGRTIASWTDKLPEDCRPAADAILLGAARSGMDLEDLTELAAEIHARSVPEDEGPDHFEERSVRLDTTFGGAGVVRGDLTPECASVVTTVLDALSAPAASGRHPDAAAALPRCAARGDGTPCREWTAARSGPGCRSRCGRISPWWT